MSKPIADLATNSLDRFDLSQRVAIITGGSGLLGGKHAEAILGAGGTVVLLDIRPVPAPVLDPLTCRYGNTVVALRADITRPADLESVRSHVLERFGHIDILINNAANNPKVEGGNSTAWSRLENFPLAQWEADVAVGLTGAFLCSQVFGSEMARCRSGVILNIASELGVIAPDQRLYRQDGLPEDRQPVKPVTYSVVKSGIIGLTRYLATYWADAGVRVNALSPGGVFNGQPDSFVQRYRDKIPLGRMANADDYQGAVLFLCSDASSFMTGANLIVDGGHSCW
jgi:NAD(P)-dependent dehydrogenase (short-subunit alcohol dehydrogenase family)